MWADPVLTCNPQRLKCRLRILSLTTLKDLLDRNRGVNYRPDIDGLRAIAVLAVLAFHANTNAFGGGFAGVDVFFVISGYLISGLILPQIEKGTFSFTDFYVRRINRILPALIVVLIASLAIGWVILVPSEFRQLGTHVVGGSTFSSNFILWHEAGYFDSQDKPLLHLWSLAVEEQFYLIWPVLAWFAWKRRWSLRLTIAALVAASLIAGVIAIQASLGTAAFYSPITRLWEIMAGALLVRSEKKLQTTGSTSSSDPFVRNAFAVIGLATLVATFMVLDRNTPWPGVWAALPVVATILIIVAGQHAFLNKHVLGNRAVVYIGLISYPLYLWHWPLIVFARIIKARPLSTVTMSGVVIIAFVLAIGTYNVVEVPIRFGARKRRSARILLVLLVIVGILGLTVRNGIARPRIDGADIAKIDAAMHDWTYPGEGGFAPGDGHMITHQIPGDTSRTVVFLGDSHAEQYWPRMVELAKIAGNTQPAISFLTYGGCSPFSNVERNGLDWTGSSYRCNEYHRRALELAADRRVVSVVYSFWWEANFDADRYLADDPAKKPLRSTGPNAELPFVALGAEIGSLKEAGKRVYIVLSNPQSVSYRPTSLLPGRLPSLSQTRLVTTIDRKSAEDFSAFVNTRLRKVAERTGAEIIDPADYLCDATSCPTVDSSGQPIYKDSNHMRASFAREHATFIDRVVMK